jgi:hypothetical protein
MKMKNETIKIGLFYYEMIDPSITKGFQDALDNSLKGKNYKYEYVKFESYIPQNKENLPDIFVIDSATLKEYINDFQMLDKENFKDINIEEYYPFSIPKDINGNLYGLPQIMCTYVFFSWNKEANPKTEKFVVSDLGRYRYINEYKENLKNTGDKQKAIELTKQFFKRVENLDMKGFLERKYNNSIIYTELTHSIKEPLLMYKTTNTFYIDLALINKRVKGEKLKISIDILKHISSQKTFLEASRYGSLALLPPRRSCINKMKEHKKMYQTMDKIISENINSIYFANFNLTLLEIKDKANWIKEQIRIIE